MKLYLNIKTLCIISVLFFGFSNSAFSNGQTNASTPATPNPITPTDRVHRCFISPEYNPPFKTWKKRKENKNQEGQDKLAFCTEKISSILGYPNNTICTETKKKYAELSKDATEACEIYAKNIKKKGGDNCAEAIKRCEGNTHTDYLSKKEKEQVEAWEEKINALQEEIEDLNEPEKAIKEIELKLVQSHHTNSATYKLCPYKASIARKAYEKADKDKDKTKEEEKLKTKEEEYNEDILDLKAKIYSAESNRDESLRLIQKKRARNDVDYKKSLKDLDIKTQGKIKAVMEKVAKDQNLIIQLDKEKQNLLNQAQKRQFVREDKCHDSALEALKIYKGKKIQRIMNKTNKISFAQLIKRSKLTKKERDKKYKQKMYKDCLNTPREQKWLIRNRKLLARDRINLIKKQKAAIKRMEAAQKENEKIAHEKHIEHGESLEANNKLLAEFKQEIELKAKEFERKIANLQEQIRNKKELLNRASLELRDLDLSDENRLYESAIQFGDVKALKTIREYESAKDIQEALKKLIDDDNNGKRCTKTMCGQSLAANNPKEYHN